MDATKVRLGAVISQDNKHIAFYRRKLNSAQVNYITTELELLSIVETVKKIRNIISRQQTVLIDYKNLTCTTFNIEQVMR